MTTILLSAALGNKVGNGGNAWVPLSWLFGLRRLGFDVHFVEQIEPGACVDDSGGPAEFERSANLALFRSVVERCDLAGAATLVCGDGARTWGRPFAELLEIAAAAALFLNVGARFDLEPILRQSRLKAYVDLDPGFVHFWLATGTPGFSLGAYDLTFTIGENVGRPGCSIPTGGLRWRPARQPVVLEHWPPVASPRPERFSTVASWRGPYGPVTFDGTTFGLKVHEFRKLAELPERAAPAAFEIALDIHPADGGDRSLLLRHGWQLVEPATVATADAFRRYIQGSGAEFSAAQGMYVQTQSGWFSDRTTRYLASGKPALVQDTGFSRNLPVGEGLLAFRTLEEAVAGARAIVRDYERHAAAACRLAEEHFGSDRVLGRLMEEIGVAP